MKIQEKFDLKDRVGNRDWRSGFAWQPSFAKRWQKQAHPLRLLI